MDSRIIEKTFREALRNNDVRRQNAIIRYVYRNGLRPTFPYYAMLCAHRAGYPIA
jgi:hypothetical protein